MTVLRAIIIDDESNQRGNIKMILEDHCTGVEVIAEGKSAIEGAALINKHNPDVVFLDVQMPGGTGFDLLDGIGKVDAEIILITAYTDYMQKAFKFNAFDYLVKPIDIDEMIKTVDRLKESRLPMSSGSLKISLPSTTGLVYVEKDKITVIRAQGSYSEVQLDDSKSLLISRNLKFFESLLGGENFMRVHRSSIINLSHVTEFSRSEGGLVVLSNGDSVPVANDNKDELLDKLANQ